MQDLTAQVYPDGPVAAMCPTSQAGGNRYSDNTAAMTAPGSKTTAGAVAEAAQPHPYGGVSPGGKTGNHVVGKSGRK